jgi:SH3-like domain-containing protein
MLDSPLFFATAGRFGRKCPTAAGIPPLRSVSAPVLLAILLLAPVASGVAEDKLPVPRFASLKSDEVNLRTGPGEDRPKLWVYQRTGMPVEIIEEFDTWRRIRDYKGTVGWVSASLLSGKRTAIVTEEEGAQGDSPHRRILRAKPDAAAAPVAELDPGVIGKLIECDGAWCRLDVKGYQGWLLRTEFWGVFPDEAVKD